MLGLRGNPFSRRSSGFAQYSNATEGQMSREMDLARENSQALGSPKANGLTNGATSHKTHSEQMAGRMSFSDEQQVTVLHDTIVITRQKFVADFDDVDEALISDSTIEGFLEYIDRQRLTFMPTRGSSWDRVLKWAEFFALQISGYANVVDSFVPDSKLAAQLIWTASRTLIHLGPDNAQALETTFGAFYRLGLSVSTLLRESTLLLASKKIRNEVGQALNSLLLLVRKVSLTYAAGSKHHASFDFNSKFGGLIAAFHQHRNNIINAMWEHSLGDGAAAEVTTLRKWLGPPDSGLQKLLGVEDTAPTDRSEYTCEWFQSRLLSFTRNKNDTLMIHAPPGSGKSVLAGWIIERLQRPIGRKAYLTLSCKIEADVPGEATSLAVVKRLLQQLLEIYVGHKEIYLELAKVFRSSRTSKSGDLEEDLWNCLDSGLRRTQDTSDTMIVVDGLDYLQGGETATKRTSTKLASIAAKHTTVQAVILSQFTGLKPNSGKVETFTITPDHTHEDLGIVINQSLQDYKYFRSRSEHSRENLVEQILHAAKGNFLWAVLTTALLKRETSEDGFMKAVKATKEATISLDETIAKLTNAMDLSRTETNLLVSLMLVADRPMSAAELTELLQVDLAKRHSSKRETDIVHDIRSSLHPLIVARGGFARFSHPIIRSYLLKVQKEEKKLRGRPAAQTEMLKRLLAYCSFNLSRTGDVTMDLVARSHIESMFSKHALLEYAIRHWTFHFRSSTMCQHADTVAIDEDFKAIFPSTTMFSTLEWTCWNNQTSRFEAMKMMDFSLRVRKATFTEHHVSVLQSLIGWGAIWRETTETTESADCFYHASLIAQQVLSKFHKITAACTNTFLTITEKFTYTSRTELVNRREKMLIYIIDAYKDQYGKNHDLVIQYSKLLAQLYISIHEEHKAENIWRELREITISRFGKGSEEETRISEKLTIALKKGDKKGDVVEYEQGIFDIVTDLEVWDTKRIKLTIDLAMSYEKRGEILMAEELFIHLWRRLTEECHHSHQTHGVELHIHSLDVVIEYIHFLQRCYRHEEASSVLICIWTEYEQYDFESETIYLRLKVIGELMREVSLLSLAVTVLRKCLSWFKSHKLHEHTTSCEVLVTTILEEITTITKSTTINTKSISTISVEVIIREFESAFSRKTVSLETVSICKRLISLHMKLEQWSAAIEVTRKSLLVIWKSVIAGSGTIALPKDYGADAVDIAISLAICHQRCSHFHEAEEIYVRVYRACRNSCRIDDERLSKAYRVLVKFYEEHRHWHRIIEIYKELLVELRTHLGVKNPLTIQTLYVLSDLCAEHGHTEAYQYYEEIIDVLNHGSHVCHADALDAMFYMCRYRYEAGHWHKLRTVCKILWETWKGSHNAHEKFTIDVVEKLYFRYCYVLEHHVHSDFSVLHQLTVEYRECCIRSFGVDAAITVKATIELAQLCMRSEKHVHQAILLYEEVLTKSKTTTNIVSSTTITTTKQRLSEAYITICGHESVSVNTLERAYQTLNERYEYLRITYGWAHAETLVCLREVLLLHLKSKKQDSASVVTRMLLEATTQIIIHEKRSQALHESGRTLGEIFISCGMNNLAMEVIQELRVQIVTGKASEQSKHGLKIDKSVGRLCFVFLVTLEQVVRGVLSTSYSQVMADYLTESVLYESYTRSLDASAVIIVGHAARLRTFLTRHERHSQREILEQQCYDIFVNKWAINARSREIGLLFYVSILIQIGDTIRDVHVGHVACLASVAQVRTLFESGQVQRAFEVAECAFDFIEHQRAYHHLQNVPAGFKLSSLLACRGVDPTVVTKIDHKLREQMFELSRKIIRGVLKACKESKIDFVRLQLRELNELVGLLGDQQNHADNEWILELLWQSREALKSWKPSTIIAIGRRFVEARYLNASKERRSEAIRLCEDICYNMRRTWGSLDPKTLEMSDLLSGLYTNMGHYREAQDIHENILRLVVEGDDGDDRTLDTMESDTALKQINLLKQSFLRLHAWNKSPEVYVDLIRELKSMPEYKDEKQWKELSLPSQWNPKETPSDTLGKFFAPQKWEFVRPENVSEDGTVKEAPSRPGANMKRATSNWGIGLIHRFLHGEHENGQTNGVSKMNGGVKSGKKAVAVDDEEGYASAEEVIHRPESKAEIVY